ncbi:MAG: beta-N-acetylhexosaminidase [bacterium]
MPFGDWTPEEKAGQHIVAGFEGLAPPASLLERIRAGRAGGVILFRRNIESAEQTLSLTHALQRAAAESPRRLPLLIAIDEEGGRVSRLSEDFTRFPAARLFGRLGDPGLVRRAAAATAAELRAAGVNMNLAPVLDVLTNPACTVIGDRAFGEEPALVGEMAAAAVSGLQAGGVAAAAKHFPGIGDMAPDPHEELPACDLQEADLRARELAPYRRALAPDLPAGPAAAVLVAHAVYTRIDPDRPASLSGRIVRGLLREGLNFGGLALTDDLEMGAIEDPAGSAMEAVAAGEDVALICRTEKIQEGALERIARALREGEIRPEAEDASLGRILAAKARFAGAAGDFAGADSLARRQREREAVVGRQSHRALREEIERLIQNMK